MFKGSWRTSAVGILGGVALLVNQAIALLDADPTTVFSFEQTISALGLLGLGWFARDKSVSSEAQGIKQQESYVWSYVAFGGVVLAFLGTIFFWFRYRERQAATLREQASVIAGLKNALATCEAARRRERHGRDDMRDALGGLRPVGDADPPRAPDAP